MTQRISLSPRLVVNDADGAISFYRRAFGSEVRSRVADPSGHVAHAELTIGSGVIALKDEDAVDTSPTSLGGTPVILTLDVDDADAVGAALESAGADVVFAIGDASYGYRQGRFRDPYGHLWLVSQQVEQQSDAEMAINLATDGGSTST